MWQYQKLSMLLGLGLVAISASTGCATSVEEPVDEQAMSDENAAESSEALTTGDDWGGGFVGPGAFAWGRRFGGYYGRGYGWGGAYGGYLGDFDGWDYGYGGYGYGGYGYGGYGGYGGDVNVIVNQNNGYPDYGPGYLPGYLPGYDDGDCGGGYGAFDDGWN